MNQINKRISVMLAGVAALASLQVATTAYAGKQEHAKGRVEIYFTRHAEKKTSVDADGLEICGSSKCAEELDAKGRMRAELLVDWFKRHGVTHRLTHAFSSHKLRTWQTIEMIATDADLDDGAIDIDKNAGDGIQEFPIFANGDTDDFATELDPESTSPSEDPTIDALLALPNGSVALVSGHSGTLYDIMAGIGLMDACGGDNDIGTCNQDRYPIDEDNKVANFGDIWKVVLRNGQAKFAYRLNLQPTTLRVVERAR